MTKQLENKIRETMKRVRPRNIGVAFSGGVDSSLLAKVCKDAGKNVTLLTVSFSNKKDIEVSSEVSKALGLDLSHELISLDELENGLKTVLALIEFDRTVRLENSTCFYYVFKLASRHGLSTVLSANGIDELFCGYYAYTRHFGDETAMSNLMKTLIATARKDKHEIDKISASFGIRHVCPFLSKSFVDSAAEIPFKLKIKSEDDRLRKHIVREVALEIGVPKSAAFRAKKALQYSSGIHKAIAQLARKKGFTRQRSRALGFHSAMEAYIENFRKDSPAD